MKPGDRLVVKKNTQTYRSYEEEVHDYAGYIDAGEEVMFLAEAPVKYRHPPHRMVQILTRSGVCWCSLVYLQRVPLYSIQEMHV